MSLGTGVECSPIPRVAFPKRHQKQALPATTLHGPFLKPTRAKVQHGVGHSRIGRWSAKIGSLDKYYSQGGRGTHLVSGLDSVIIVVNVSIIITIEGSIMTRAPMQATHRVSTSRPHHRPCTLPDSNLGTSATSNPAHIYQSASGEKTDMWMDEEAD
jgi:hypothetical protein